MKTILVIEDNWEMRENTAELLSLAGYNVLSAPNGKIGYEKALEDTPDVILCDIMMPEIDGLSFLKLMRSNKSTNNIPLIFFSAGSAPATIRKDLAQYNYVYLAKPFTNEELLSVVSLTLH